MTKWNGFCASLTAACFLFSTASSSARPSRESNPPSATSRPSITEKQTAEYVFDHDCLEALEPALNFKVHVPLKADGGPDEKAMYTTGDVAVRVKKGCQPRLAVTRSK